MCFACPVSNAACVRGCHGCTHRRGGSTLRHRTQRLLWPGGSDPKLVCREPSRPAPLGPPAAWRSSLQPRVQPQCCREPLPGRTLLRLAFKPLGRRRLSILPWSDFQHFDCFVSPSNLPRFDIAWGPLSFLDVWAIPSSLSLPLVLFWGCPGENLCLLDGVGLAFLAPCHSRLLIPNALPLSFRRLPSA